MKYFTEKGDPMLFSCPCGECDIRPSPRLLFLLQGARAEAGVPFTVTSGPRCEEYNKLVGGVPASEHITGEGADISCLSSSSRFSMISAALHTGFTRIGIGSNFIHMGSGDGPQNVIWLY